MNNHKQRQEELMGVCIAIGAGAGTALGLVLMQIWGNGFFAAGIAIGVTLGTTAGLILGRRER